MWVLCTGAASATAHFSCSTRKYSGVLVFFLALSLSHIPVPAFPAFVTEPRFGAFPLVFLLFISGHCNLPTFGGSYS